MSARGPGWWLAVVAAAAMALVVAAGLWVLGTPAHQRALRLDARRVQDLRQVSTYIGMYWQQHKALPPALGDLDGNASTLRDPLTQAPYGYAVTGTTGYRLCATFQQATPSDEDQRTAWIHPGGVDAHWRHPAGRHCFDRSVKP